MLWKPGFGWEARTGLWCGCVAKTLISPTIDKKNVNFGILKNGTVVVGYIPGVYVCCARPHQHVRQG